MTYMVTEWEVPRSNNRIVDATMTEATAHAVAAEYPHSTLNGTLNCSSHSGTALYETHLAGQEDIWMCN